MLFKLKNSKFKKIKIFRTFWSYASQFCKIFEQNYMDMLRGVFREGFLGSTPLFLGNFFNL